MVLPVITACSLFHASGVKWDALMNVHLPVTRELQLCFYLLLSTLKSPRESDCKGAGAGSWKRENISILSTWAWAVNGFEAEDDGLWCEFARISHCACCSEPTPTHQVQWAMEGGKVQVTSSLDEVTWPHLELTTSKQTSKVQPSNLFTVKSNFFLLKTVLGRFTTIKYRTVRIPHVLFM